MGKGKNRKKRNLAKPSPQGSDRIKAPNNERGPRNQEHPSFCLKHLPADKKGGLQSCEKGEKIDLINKLDKLSKFTWQQIQVEKRHGYGHEIISRDSLRIRIPDGITEETRILAFRFSKKKPMIGYRRESVFHIIYLDRNFDAYDHE